MRPGEMRLPDDVIHPKEKSFTPVAAPDERVTALQRRVDDKLTRPIADLKKRDRRMQGDLNELKDDTQEVGAEMDALNSRIDSLLKAVRSERQPARKIDADDDFVKQRLAHVRAQIKARDTVNPNFVQERLQQVREEIKQRDTKKKPAEPTPTVHINPDFDKQRTDQIVELQNRIKAQVASVKKPSTAAERASYRAKMNEQYPQVGKAVEESPTAPQAEMKKPLSPLLQERYDELEKKHVAQRAAFLKAEKARREEAVQAMEDRRVASRARAETNKQDRVAGIDSIDTRLMRLQYEIGQIDEQAKALKKEIREQFAYDPDKGKRTDGKELGFFRSLFSFKLQDRLSALQSLLEKKKPLEQNISDLQSANETEIGQIRQISTSRGAVTFREKPTSINGSVPEAFNIGDRVVNIKFKISQMEAEIEDAKSRIADVENDKKLGWFARRSEKGKLKDSITEKTKEMEELKKDLSVAEEIQKDSVDDDYQTPRSPKKPAVRPPRSTVQHADVNSRAVVSGAFLANEGGKERKRAA